MDNASAEEGDASSPSPRIRHHKRLDSSVDITSNRVSKRNIHRSITFVLTICADRVPPADESATIPYVNVAEALQVGSIFIRCRFCVCVQRLK